MLILHELMQVFVLVKQFTVTASTETFSHADTARLVQHFPIQLFAIEEESSQNIKQLKWPIRL